ncbi:hypothetical protein SB781_40015, partial [Paraburkholderia sp. SIMBA_061]
VQFLKAKTEAFQQWLHQLQQKGIVKSELDQYWGVNGMRTITKHFATGLETQTQSQVVNLAYDADRWRVTTENGQTEQSR